MEALPHRRQRRLRLSIPIRDPKLPVVHLRPAPKPFVGPRINKHPCAARGEGRANLPAELLCLRRLAIPQTVQAYLRHDQRPVAGDVVQAGEIGVEGLLRFQIDVEAG